MTPFKEWEFWDDEFFIHEFEADGAPAEDEEEEDFSMDDEGEEVEDNNEPESQDTEGEENPSVEDEEEEFSMDNEGEDNNEAEPQTAEAEPQDVQPAEDGEEEFSMDDEGEGSEQPPTEEGDGEENYELPDDEGSEGDTDAPPAEDGEEEFSMDDEGGEEGGDDQSQEFTDGENQDMPSEEDETITKLKELESVIFDDLSEEEKNMKITELKALYITVYKKCGTISEMLSGIKKDEETIQIIEYISNTLIDLKEYVNDYINKVFDSKTYIENLAQLQKYIMIFNAINKVFEQIKAENEE